MNGKAPAKEASAEAGSPSDVLGGEKMKPCPFCEPLKQALVGEPILAGFGEVRAPGENWHGLCPACGAEGPKETDPVSARKAWNRRAYLELVENRGGGRAQVIEECAQVADTFVSFADKNHKQGAVDRLTASDIALCIRQLSGATTDTPKVTQCNSVREETILECIAAVDKELENGSPKETWNDTERARESARQDALEVLAALSSEGEEEQKRLKQEE